MPVIVYECPSCGHDTERLFHVGHRKPATVACERCNVRAKRKWSGVRLGLVGGFREYTDVHTTGNPVAITSRKQQLQFWKDHGVHNPGDPFS